LQHNSAEYQEIRAEEDKNPVENSSILWRLTAAISDQNKEAVKSNNLHHNKILCELSWEESKKDRIKKIHPSILKMINCAAAMSSNDDKNTFPETCSQFINQENVGTAQYDLVHQFKEQGFPDIAFASGTMQALLSGSSYFPTRAPQATIQSLLSTNKSPIWMITKKITLFVTSFKSKGRRNC
jgi:hypothetical protein